VSYEACWLKENEACQQTKTKVDQQQHKKKHLKKLSFYFILGGFVSNPALGSVVSTGYPIPIDAISEEVSSFFSDRRRNSPQHEIVSHFSNQTYLFN
jgi:Trk-type K+ transport system membrane component